jgi:hypothetical protein
MSKKDLVQIIRDNPGCVATIDNDGWVLCREHPGKISVYADDFDQWQRENELANDGDVTALGDGGYGSGNCYGGDILQALAKIVGITVESV